MFSSEMLNSVTSSNPRNKLEESLNAKGKFVNDKATFGTVDK